MPELVTLEETKARLNILHSEDDHVIEAWLDVCEEIVLDHIAAENKSGWWDDELVSGGEVPKRVQTAVIMLTGYFYRSPDHDSENGFKDYGRLPYPVVAILHRLHDPALA